MRGLLQGVAGGVAWLLLGGTALGWSAASASAATGHLPPACSGTVWRDADADGRRGAREPGIAGIKVSDGTTLALTDAQGRYTLPQVPGRTIFVVKPAAFAFPLKADGLPDFWRHVPDPQAPSVAFGGIRGARSGCRDFALLDAPAARAPALDVLVFTDTQVKQDVDIGYYRTTVVEPLVAKGVPAADVGLTLGDVVDDDLSLYGRINAVTARLGTPWLHVPGNHDMDVDAPADAAALLTFRNTYGPDTYAWEDRNATFVVMDDVVHLPGQKPAYVGGLREDQFAFLEAYLPTAPRDRLLVVAMHIPLFEPDPAVTTFRTADRERLFRLLQDLPHVLLLTGHTHNQQHFDHGAATGWHGSTPLHEYNVGAVCGAFWSGPKTALGAPRSTMTDGTPPGYARMAVAADGAYALAYHPVNLPAGDPAVTGAMALHGPRVLRKGAYAGYGLFANVYMGQDGSDVAFRVDGGAWRPMKRVAQPDPRLLEENLADDAAETLRSYDRTAEAKASRHLWRASLPTDLAVGTHAVDVRFIDPWQGEQMASTTYRLDDAAP